MTPADVIAAVKRHPRVFGAALLTVSAAIGPSAVWKLMPSRTLEVVIVDKTVPFENYREHGAVPWLLHAMKIRRRSGGFLSAKDGYVGFDPTTRTGTDLSPAALEGADVLFVADTYGVYRGDYESPRQEAALERSPKIYGGVSDDEARAIEAFAARGGLVVAEFNTFASPTDDAPRERLERLLGVRWTKWVARYWPNITDEREVPKWVARVWERVNHSPFDFTGGALVFVREDRDIVVLRDREDLAHPSEAVSQVRTPAGARLDMPAGGHFSFWFDVVDATDSDVLYEHVVGVTPAGAAKLEEHGLRPRFPAITRRRDAWYFAGDFVDVSVDLGSPERAGLLEWRAHMSGYGGTIGEGSFWSFYVPVLRQIFSSRAR